MVTFLEMIDFKNALFNLPFAYLGAFLAVRGLPSGYHLFWITMAMVGARTAAMALNRVIDRYIDARDPRTAGRPIPSGRISVLAGYVACVLSFLLLFVAAARLNRLCVELLPIAVFVLVIYSYMKRFSWTAQLVLGLASAMGPVGSWIAITGRFDLPPILLGLAVGFWVAGLDTIYACQDREFDIKEGLHSIPVKFGIPGALKIAALMHILTVVLLLAAGWSLHLGGWFLIGVLLVAVVLVVEHSLVSPADFSRIHTASFAVNRYVGIMVLVFSLLDLFSRLAG
jgi:4-hydroxybenzoate polyprenyltransferase